MTYTWDGQPAADLDAAWDAMLAAAWCEGRDAAIAVARARATDLRNHDRSRLEAGLITQQMHALTPPPDLAAALAEHTRRAVEAERTGAIDAMWQVLNASRIASGWSELETQEIGVAVMDAIRARSAP